ncbi:hypothetical protein ACO2Q8_17290 [Larkinella sp. VNQ87]|uniref:hypothetical protein n=1 Tax=Larkinella sp. VNQ87 TaxID=3400921 RepID=UPI003C0257E8
MEKKRIVVYQDLNEPYEKLLADGLNETPEERYVKFFRMQARLWALKGRPFHERKVILKPHPWI